MVKEYRIFKRNHKILHILIIAVAVVMFWRGTWGILDHYLFPDNRFVSYALSILLAIFILYVDKSSFKELE